MARGLVVTASALLGGCYPTLPPHLAEGTDVLRPGGVSLTVAAGGAGFAANCCRMGATTATEGVGGGEVRARVGIGARQEVGASLFGGAGSTYAPSAGTPFAIGGKLSYKIAPTPWLAFVADAGALAEGAAAVAIVSGDLAVIAAPYTAANGSQLYVAARGSFGIPFLSGARNANEAVDIPIGVSLRLSPRLRVLFEGGPVFGFAQEVTDSAPNATQSVTSIGAYGAAAISFVLR